MNPSMDRGDGIQLAYRYDTGKQPTLVFLPGFMSDMTGDKATAIAQLATDTGHACLRLDYSGNGASEGAFTDGTIGRWTQDALFLIDTLTLGPLILIGSSMGGWIALLIALARPEGITALILIAAAPDFTETLMWQEFDAAERETLLHGGVLRIPGAYGRDQVITKQLIDDGRTHLLLGGDIALSCPVRLLHGQRDADVPWETALKIASRLTSADVQTMLIKDGDHRLSRQQDIALLRSVVAELL